MAIADSNRVKIVYAEESTIGTTETGTGQEYRLTGESLNANRAFVTSDELRSDRMTADTVATEETNEGDLNIEWSYGTHNDFLEGALQSTLSTALTYSETDCSAVAADDSINDASASFPVSDISVGQWIRVSGFTETANNGVFRVASVTASKITFDRKIGSADPGIVDEAAGDTVTLEGQFIKNGTTKHGYTVEKQILGLGANDKYQVFTGMEVDGMSMEASVGSILSGAFSFIGRSNVTQGTSTFSSETATTSTDVLNAVDDLGHVFYAGSSYDDGFQDISFELSNNLRAQRQIGSFALAGVGSGRLNITGSASAYFTGSGDSDTIDTNFNNSTGAELEMAFTDNAGNTVVFNFPNVKMTSQQKVAGGIDTDVLMEFEWEAVRDATSDSMIRVSVVPA